MKTSTHRPIPRLDDRYRHLHAGFLWDKNFRHIWLLIFWPLFGLGFYLLEWLDSHGMRLGQLTTVESPLDSYIPFCEWFVFPYLFWFVFLVGMYAYTLFFEVDIFRKFMWFTILTYGSTLVIYLLFPTQQMLRPEAFPRDNFLTRFMADYYVMDTHTNVCPSLHVIGAFAVQTAAWNSKLFGTRPWRIAFTITAILISVSTVFLKQHSILDTPPALLLCAVAYVLVYRLPDRKAKKKSLPQKA